jgi:hypothetical protein
MAALATAACERTGYQSLLEAPQGEPGAICEENVCTTLLFGENSTDTNHGVTADTTIYESDPTQNFGGAASLIASGLRIGLFRFDLSTLPLEATIVDAVLSLRVLDNASTNLFTVHEILEEWTEGTGLVTPTTNAAANWNERMTGVAWTAVGCEAPGSRSSATLGTFEPTSIETTYPVDIDVDVVQRWVDGTHPNFGFAVTAIGSDGAKLGAREALDSERPSLLVTFY